MPEELTDRRELGTHYGFEIRNCQSEIRNFCYHFIMNKIFGKKLKELRISAQLTQAQLADTFHVSKTTICQWETSKQEPGLEDLAAIANFFNVSADYLLGLEDT